MTTALPRASRWLMASSSRRAGLLASRRLFSASTDHGITKVGVVGLGLMGHGIAQTAAEKASCWPARRR